MVPTSFVVYFTAVLVMSPFIMVESELINICLMSIPADLEQQIKDLTTHAHQSKTSSHQEAQEATDRALQSPVEEACRKQNPMSGQFQVVSNDYIDEVTFASSIQLQVFAGEDSGFRAGRAAITLGALHIGIQYLHGHECIELSTSSSNNKVDRLFLNGMYSVWGKSV